MLSSRYRHFRSLAQIELLPARPVASQQVWQVAGCLAPRGRQLARAPEPKVRLSRQSCDSVNGRDQWETDMRGAALIAVLAVGVSGATAACGQASGGKTVHCVRPKLSDNAFEISDNGKTFCAGTGTGIYVFLHSGRTQAHLWRSIHPSSGVLEGRASGMMSLARGVTGAYFGAARPGTVTLTSTRSPCAAAGSPCATRLLFKVTVVVRSIESRGRNASSRWLRFSAGGARSASPRIKRTRGNAPDASNQAPPPVPACWRSRHRPAESLASRQCTPYDGHGLFPPASRPQTAIPSSLASVS